MISVRRHLTKNRPRLPQKSSETPSTALLVRRERGPKDPVAHKGRGPKDPATQTLNCVVAPFHAPSRSLRQLLVHEQDRRGYTDGKQQSRLGLVTLTQDASIPASSRLRAVGVTASPHFYDGFDAVLARRR